MEYTDEQVKICDFVKNNINNKDVIIKINAFAGTGKTTTLKMIAEAMPNKNFLYLAFNKGMADDLKKNCPNNITVLTIHGFAYKYTRNIIAIDNNLKNHKMFELAMRYKLELHVASAAFDLLSRYCNSDAQDEPNVFLKKLEYVKPFLKTVAERSKRDIKPHDVISYTQKMWDDMLTADLEPTHDFYLKFFDINVNKYLMAPAFDGIMLDEAQDSNGVTISIFNKIKANVRIAVGDEHQQIYAFRDSVNALHKIKTDNVFYLTNSFRFGKNIAFRANNILHKFKNEKIDIVGTKQFNDKPNDNEESTKCYIGRTNAGIIKKMIELSENNIPFKTVRDPKLIFSLILNILYYLYDIDTGFNSEKYIKNYNNINHLISSAEISDDIELLTAGTLVKKFSNEPEKLIEIFETANSYHKSRKKIKTYLSTAHTVKGLEFDIVDILYDFIPFKNHLERADLAEKEYLKNIYKYPLLSQEVNLYYIAVTRAIRECIGFPQSFFMNGYPKGWNISR